MNNKKQDPILILTESGENIGLGHYTRCSAIRDKIKQSGGTSEMLIYLPGEDTQIFSLRFIDWIKNPDILKTYKDKGYEKVLIDSYLAGTKNYEICKEIFSRIYVIDDYNRIKYPEDTRLINPNIYGDTVDYSNQSGVKLYTGKEYLILREIFREQPLYHQQTIKENIEEIVITVGGSDFNNLLPEIIDIVQKKLPNVSLTILAGNPIDEHKIQKQCPGFQTFGYLSAEEIYTHFSKTDLVISACGQTLHELSATGKPTIGICIEKDQRLNQEYYLQTGFLSLKINKENLRFIEKDLEYLKSPEERRKRQRISQQIINRNGVDNIIQLLND